MDSSQAQSGATSSTAPPPADASSMPALPTMNPEDSPYKPLDLPQQQPRATAPPPQDDSQQQNLGAVSHAGAAAYMIDKILKGASHGVAVGQQYAADQYNKKLAAVQSLHEDQAKQFYTMAKEGRAGTFTGPPDAQGKPTFVPSAEFTKLNARRKITWDAMMQTVGERIPQPKKGKKGAGQGATGGIGQGEDQTALLQQAFDHKNDPQGSLAAIYRIGVAIGDPVVHQVTGFLTPEYIAKQQQGAQTADTQGKVGGLTAGNQLTQQQAVAARDRVLNVPKDQRTAKDEQDLQSAEDILAPQAKPATANFKEFISLADPKNRQWYDVTKEIPQGWTAAPVGAGSNRAPKENWTKINGQWGSQLYSPDDNQPIPGTFNSSKVPPANVLSMFPRENTLTGKFVDSNGVLQTYGTTSTSRKELPGGIGESSTTPSASSAPSATSTAPRMMVTPNPKGLVEPGNIPIDNRPTVQNTDGTHSSEYSVSFTDDKGHEVLVPTVVNGKFLTPDGKKPREGSPAERAMFKAAWDHYTQTGENLGKFDNAANADAYATALHNRGNKPSPLASRPPASSGLKPPASSAGGSKTTPIGYVGSKAYKDLQATADKASAVSSSLARESQQALTDAKTLLANPADGPAKMGLVANYLRNVVGAHSASGAGGASVRITNNEWQSAIQTRSAWEGFLSHFNTTAQGGDVILTGITLTPKQALGMAREIQQRALGARTEHGTMAAAVEEQRKKDMQAGGLTPPAAATSHDDEIMNLLHPKQ